MLRQAREAMEGVAIFAKSNMQHADYRHGHDIAVPLPLKMKLEDLQDIPPLDRKYFATFKVGKRIPLVLKNWLGSVSDASPYRCSQTSLLLVRAF